MTLYLIRHGLASAGVEDLDPGLAEVGHAQARATAAALARLVGPAPSVELFVSPLRRTRETAEPIAATLGAAALIRPEVGEVFDPAMDADARQAMIGPFMAGRWSDQPTVLREWRARVLEYIRAESLTADSSGADLVVVTHYIAIGALIGAALEDDRVVPVRIANASISRFAVSNGALTLLEPASVAHLPPDLITGLERALPGGS